jgi:hypothetical protein
MPPLRRVQIRKRKLLPPKIAAATVARHRRIIGLFGLNKYRAATIAEKRYYLNPPFLRVMQNPLRPVRFLGEGRKIKLFGLRSSVPNDPRGVIAGTVRHGQIPRVQQYADDLLNYIRLLFYVNFCGTKSG